MQALLWRLMASLLIICKIVDAPAIMSDTWWEAPSPDHKLQPIRSLSLVPFTRTTTRSRNNMWFYSQASFTLLFSLSFHLEQIVMRAVELIHPFTWFWKHELRATLVRITLDTCRSLHFDMWNRAFRYLGGRGGWPGWRRVDLRRCWVVGKGDGLWTVDMSRGFLLGLVSFWGCWDCGRGPYIVGRDALLFPCNASWCLYDGNHVGRRKGANGLDLQISLRKTVSRWKRQEQSAELTWYHWKVLHEWRKEQSSLLEELLSLSFQPIVWYNRRKQHWNVPTAFFTMKHTTFCFWKTTPYG